MFSRKRKETVEKPKPSQVNREDIYPCKNCHWRIGNVCVLGLSIPKDRCENWMEVIILED